MYEQQPLGGLYEREIRCDGPRCYHRFTVTFSVAGTSYAKCPLCHKRVKFMVKLEAIEQMADESNDAQVKLSDTEDAIVLARIALRLRPGERWATLNLKSLLKRKETLERRSDRDA